MDKRMKEFPVTIYGNIEQFSPVLSKARCRIFYRGGNRNGTFITDDFAEKLISSLHYVPVKGIYEGDDFTDHGKERTEGRIYGVVPESNNFSWETHLDEDGIEREYACTDVLLYTGLYKESAEIINKSQSMELFSPTLEYHYEIIHGQKWVVFDDGCFLGLQALGDSVEPCFEGAAFYSDAWSDFEKAVHKIEEYVQSYQGGQEMKLNFKLSDAAKHDLLWSLLNEDYTEEGNWTVSYSVVSIYDDYALAFSYETGTYERIYYTKDDATDSLVINAKKKCYVVDVTEDEKNTLDTLRTLNGDTYEVVNEDLANASKTKEENSEYAKKVEELTTENSEFAEKITKLEEDYATLNIEKDNLLSANEEYTTQIDGLNEQVAALEAYKLSIENAEKEEVINSYDGKISDATLNSYREKMDEYTALELDKELTYELKKANSSAFNFSLQQIPKDEEFVGVDAILAKYVK